MRDTILIDALDRAEGMTARRVVSAAVAVQAYETLGMRPPAWRMAELAEAARAWVAAMDAVEAACAGDSEDA